MHSPDDNDSTSLLEAAAASKAGSMFALPTVEDVDHDTRHDQPIRDKEDGRGNGDSGRY